jgi:hypothetical protein
MPTLDVIITKDDSIKIGGLRPTFNEKLKNETKGIENEFYKRERSFISKSNSLSKQ